MFYLVKVILFDLLDNLTLQACFQTDTIIAQSLVLANVGVSYFTVLTFRQFLVYLWYTRNIRPPGELWILEAEPLL